MSGHDCGFTSLSLRPSFERSFRGDMRFEGGFFVCRKRQDEKTIHAERQQKKVDPVPNYDKENNCEESGRITLFGQDLLKV